MPWNSTDFMCGPWEADIVNPILYDFEGASNGFSCCPQDETRHKGVSELVSAPKYKDFPPWNSTSQTTRHKYSLQRPSGMNQIASQQVAKEEQAAKALAILSHSGPESGQGLRALDCCKPCYQPCSTDEITPCWSKIEEPCYDSNCSEVCELDGESIICNEPHSDDFWCNFPECDYRTPSEERLSNHLVLEHQRNIESQWSDCQQSASALSASHPGLHHSHHSDGCINPSLLHAPGCSQSHAPFTECIIPDNLTTRYPPFKDSDHHRFCPSDFLSYHPRMQTPTQQRQSQNSLEQPIVSANSSVNLISYSDDVSREDSSSITPTDHSISPHTSSVSESFDWSLEFESTTPKNLPKKFVCCWMMGGPMSLCLCAFASPWELQAHVEDNHLAACGDQLHGDRASCSLCLWRGCPAASSQKKWRQLQHLKDHIRTHTKRKWKPQCTCYGLIGPRQSISMQRMRKVVL